MTACSKDGRAEYLDYLRRGAQGKFHSEGPDRPTPPSSGRSGAPRGAAARAGLLYPGGLTSWTRSPGGVREVRSRSMEKRRLGRNGPLVSAMGLGCMGMSQSYGEADRAGSARSHGRSSSESRSSTPPTTTAGGRPSCPWSPVASLKPVRTDRSMWPRRAGSLDPPRRWSVRAERPR
jgi:hypothetical protein